MSGTAGVSTQFAAATSATGAQLDGNFSTIVAYINDPTNRNNYVADSGTTNTIALTFSPPVAGGYTAGLEITFKAALGNSGAVVVNANSLGNKSLVNHDGSALLAGQILQGATYKAVYDGTQFIFLSGMAPASQAQQETATSVATFVSPGRQQFHPSAPKAWVSFSGTGTPAILASYNVSSITDNGTGNWTINFLNPLSSANYAVVATLVNLASLMEIVQFGTKTTAGVQIRAFTATAAGDATKLTFDSPQIDVVCFGDLP